MTKPTDLTKALARRLGFLDPVRAYAAEVVRLERRAAKVANQVGELTAMVESLDAKLLDYRAEMARLHYGARKATRAGSEPRALRFLSDKRQAEGKVRELEEEVEAGRRLLRTAVRQRDELMEGLDELKRSFQSSAIVRLADDVARNTRPPQITGRREESRRALLQAEARAALDDPDDPFGDLPELSNEDDRLLVARWRAEDRARAA